MKTISRQTQCLVSKIAPELKRAKTYSTLSFD